MNHQRPSHLHVGKFLESVKEAFNGLYEALANGQHENISQIARTIKEASTSFDVATFTALWSELEDTAYHGDFLATAQQLNLIEAEFPKVKATLEANYPAPLGKTDFVRGPNLILVVDDDDYSRDMLRMGLSAQGYRVLEACDGAQALEVLKQLQPSLILLDEQMPNVGGLEFCRRLQALPKVNQIPVLLVTANDNQTIIDQALEACAADYIVKPIHWPVLLKRVERLLLARQAEFALKNAQSELERQVRQRTAELTAANLRLEQESISREQVKALLLKNEAQLRRLTDNMLDIIWQTNTDGIIQYASPSCRTTLGYAPEELLGQSVFTWMHPDDLEHIQDEIYNVGRAEYRYQSADGMYIWLETLSNWLFEDSSTPTGLVWASRDITVRKRAEQELEELNRLKTEFLSTAAHELRTPLVSIRGFTEILLMRDLEVDRQKRYLTLINDQSVQLGHILDDLLDISRLEAKQKMTLDLASIDLSNLLTAVVSLFEGASRHNIVMRGAESCPAIIGDSARLAQVFKNLVSNAIKYSPNGGTITITLQSQGDQLQFSIHDQGIGLTPEHLSHLFEKFYRADASNTAIGGTGLGLSICKVIVELHGGKIWAESGSAQGATFFVTLPLLPMTETAKVEPAKSIETR